MGKLTKRQQLRAELRTWLTSSQVPALRLALLCEASAGGPDVVVPLPREEADTLLVFVGRSSRAREAWMELHVADMTYQGGAMAAAEVTTVKAAQRAILAYLGVRTTLEITQGGMQ